ncbi:protein NIM1-INTERACTING 2 [Malania oleifera]|uniref:protein NIM1-INTERACTING 2 n=1 Tax=Malania oleifera TaxID=397392 RepID=UPI0025AEBD6D|nr:protein NIM1-INTERACTING 2 [Malania oleifera]
MSGAKAKGREKRRQEENDDVSDGQKKAREDRNGRERTGEPEEDVEEFFAILRRIHVAVGYFKNGDGRKLTPEKSNWRAWLESSECGVESSGVRVRGEAKGKKEGVEENGGLDLNALPGSDGNPV